MALTVLAFAGCGGNSADYLSSKTVIDFFKARTGITLIRDPALGGGEWDVLDADDGEDPSRHYGAFTIYVVKPGEDGSALTGREVGAERVVRPISPEEGLYWDHETSVPGAEFWSAVKRYHDNVYLSWIGGKKKGTDKTFDRLDSALQDLP